MIFDGNGRMLGFLIEVVEVGLDVGLKILHHVVGPVLVTEEVKLQRIRSRKKYHHHKMALQRCLWIILKYFTPRPLLRRCVLPPT